MLKETDGYIGKRIKEFLDKCPSDIFEDINENEVYLSRYRNRYGTWHFESPEDGHIIIRRDIKLNEKLPGDSDLTIRLCDESLEHGCIGDIY